MSTSEKPDDETGGAPTEGKARQYAVHTPDEGQPVPLFLRDGNEGRKGTAQDEKDETGE